ncbi:hypothetical protein CKF94_17760 [Vibrio coralliilyticus]|uniref:hypothetical protein n=1 Tax=Vibrio coralliilyticus TaxID=190893 RepID=UPI000BAAA832|nr:hypothetical protein [Vibrio coralliilyticus]PAU36824.1 hypothetical protein CKF94_17760 [Vibrio coralliilyticus]
MHSKALTQFISLLMLLVVAMSMTASTIGEFRSHGLASVAVAKHHHTHSIHHPASAIESELASQHDANSHSHDKADIKDASLIAFSHLIEADIVRPAYGLPIRKPFRIERPPRTQLFI